MKLEVKSFGLVITPESIQDEVYIERLLGLKKEGDYVLLQRHNASGLGTLAWLETREAPEKKEGRL